MSHEGQHKGIDVERVLAAVERAFCFIEAQGGELAQLRFRILLEREDVGMLADFLEARPPQADDEFLSYLELSAILDDHGLLQTEWAREHVCRLADRIEMDGRWSNPDRVEEARHLFLTGMLTSFFVKSGCVSLSVTDVGLETMMRAWSQERVNALSWGLLAAYTHLLTHQAHERGDEALSWCGRELSKGLRGGALSALQVARILLFCNAFALPGMAEDCGSLIPLLLREQLPDGSFQASPEALGLRTPSEATLSAVMALSRFSRELAGLR